MWHTTVTKCRDSASSLFYVRYCQCWNIKTHLNDTENLDVSGFFTQVHVMEYLASYSFVCKSLVFNSFVRVILPYVRSFPFYVKLKNRISKESKGFVALSFLKYTPNKPSEQYFWIIFAPKQSQMNYALQMDFIHYIDKELSI